MNYQLNNLYSKILSNDNYNIIIGEDEEFNINSEYLIVDNSIVSLNTEKLLERLFFDSIEKILDIKYNNEFSRVFKLFTKIIVTTEREIMNICSISKKNLSEIIKILKYENIISINATTNTLILNNLFEKNKLIENNINFIFNMIYCIKIDLDDKINLLEKRGSSDLQEEYMNKAYSYISKLDDLILVFNNIKNFKKNKFNNI
jgi:hypothetical protein